MSDASSPSLADMRTRRSRPRRARLAPVAVWVVLVLASMLLAVPLIGDPGRTWGYLGAGILTLGLGVGSAWRTAVR